jgi:hypothetical protein
VKARPSACRASVQRLLVFAAGAGLLLVTAAVVANFVISLAIIRSYDSDLAHSPGSTL